MPLSARAEAVLLAFQHRPNRIDPAEAKRLAAETGGVVLAQESRHDGSPMGAMVSLDPSGKWRVTRFDADGFSGHMVFADKRAAVMDALTSGYRDTDRNLLRRLCRTQRFCAHIWEA